MDRASGSGVFARDPDALLDLTELELTDELKAQQRGKARIRGIERALNEFSPGWQQDIGQDDRLSPSAMEEFANKKLNFDQSSIMSTYISEAEKVQDHVTAWRIEGTLREFAPFDPLNLWFKYPIHISDDTGMLKDIQPDTGDPWVKRKQTFAKAQKKKGDETLQSYLDALGDLMPDGTNSIDVDTLAEAMGKDKNRIRKDFKGTKRYPGHSKALKEAGYEYQDGTNKEPGKIVRVCPDNE